MACKHTLLAALLVWGAIASAQAQTPLAATVPAFGNPDCPIMGKKVSDAQFVDVEGGRIYICCAPCVRKIQADPKTAYEAAYPTVRKIGNKVCPVSGKEIPEKAETVILQGQEISLCCKACVEGARKNHQLTLTLANHPKLVVVGNKVCPVDGQPVDNNAIVVVDGAIVHLSSLKHIEKFNLDAKAALEKARKSATKPTKDL